MTKHDVAVTGVWQNDTTASVMVWCNTCEAALMEGESLTPEQINAAVSQHVTPADETPAER